MVLPVSSRSGVTMSILLHVDPEQVDAAIDAEYKALAGRVRGAMERVGRASLLMPARDATRLALRSNRLPTTWRGQVQPKDNKPTLAPAFFVWSKAPEIMAAFLEGAVIAPTGGKKYLWIPTPNVPRGQGGKRYSPQRVEARFKGFFFVKARGGALVAMVRARAGTKRSRARGARRTLSWKRATKKDAGQRVAMFILLKQVRLKKRLDIAGIANQAGARYAVAYDRAANSQ